MALFKCKMCGGELNIEDHESVAVCEYCGTKQTIPNIDDDKRATLYERANHFRRENEFDKAMAIYESILEDDKEDCEAYWGLVLCKYGIEYVEDPQSHKRVPTVNRAQYTSVFVDEDYQSAIKYADSYQKDVYEAEASVIDIIQKGILEISQKEEPFDIFICYKETDSKGVRTQDSVYAQNIYKDLTDEGYKVFFSRITLEDKLGVAYEPYIFAALNSAKVMLVVGTNRDNFNAVWVKNEWSRYLPLMKKDKDKTLIPVYKDMDPYDLPQEFKYLQAQDMNKVGFMQDLLHGIQKIISKQEIETRQKAGTTDVIVDTMINRATTALANGDWETAKRCYSNVIDYDDNNLNAYIGLLFAKYSVKTIDELANLKKYDAPISECAEYDRIMHLTKDDFKKKLIQIDERSKKRTKGGSLVVTKILIVLIIIGVIVMSATVIYRHIIYPNNIYNNAVSMLNYGEPYEAYQYFVVLDDFKDSKDYVEQSKIEIINKLRDEGLSTGQVKSSLYNNGIEMDSKEVSYICAKHDMDLKKYPSAIYILSNECKDYKDSNELIKECRDKR